MQAEEINEALAAEHRQQQNGCGSPAASSFSDSASHHGSVHGGVDGGNESDSVRAAQAHKYFLTALAIVSFLALGGMIGVTGPAIPGLAAKLDTRETKLGSLFTCRGIGYLCGSFLSNYLDKFLFKQYVLLVSLLLAGIATGLAAYIITYPALLTFLAIQGFGLGGVDVAGNALVLDLWTDKTVEPLMQALHAAFGIGAVISPLLVGHYTYQPAFMIVAVCSALPLLTHVLTLPIPYLHPPPVPSHTIPDPHLKSPLIDDEGEAPLKADLLPHLPPHPSSEPASRSHSSPKSPKQPSRSFQRIYTRPSNASQPHLPRISVTSLTSIPIDRSTSRPPSPNSLPSPHPHCYNSSRRSSRETHREDESVPSDNLRPLPFIIRASITGALFFYVGIEVGYGGWIATVLLLDHLTESRRVAAYAPAVFWAAVTTGRVLAIPLAIPLSPARFLLLQLSITSIGTILVLTIASMSIPCVNTASAIFGSGMSSMFPLMMTLPRSLGFRMDMPATSTFLIGSCIGDAVIPLLIGVLMQHLGVQAFGYSMLVAVLLIWTGLGIVGWAASWGREEVKEERKEEVA